VASIDDIIDEGIEAGKAVRAAEQKDPAVQGLRSWAAQLKDAFDTASGVTEGLEALKKRAPELTYKAEADGTNVRITTNIRVNSQSGFGNLSVTVTPDGEITALGGKDLKGLFDSTPEEKITTRDGDAASVVRFIAKRAAATGFVR
jgi:hypothetical protein